MIEVILSGKANARFIVKNKKKIEMWKMLAEKNMPLITTVKIKEIEQKEKK